ncbi:MAG: hypothetical protein WBV31_02680 [Terriglobales bacterium]|jgi:hypothetical protein
MRKYVVISFSLILWAEMCAGLLAETQIPKAPQTARQALMEMFFNQEPGTFLKHLPAVTRAALEKSGTLTSMQQYSALAGQIQTQGKSFKTFETGPVMLATEDPKTGQKFEIVVDKDSLQGDQDEIEVSFRSYKDNQAQPTAFKPRIVFSMKMESGLWKLNDIAITVNLPLDDADFLKRISDGIAARAAAASPLLHTQGIGQAPGQITTPITTRIPNNTFGSDTSTLTALRKILKAESTYAATYPAVGYTCSLSDLGGFGASEPNERQAMLIDIGLVSGKHQGYSFSLSGCAGTPAASFQLTATPIGNSYGRRAFCSDRSGIIRFSTDGQAATCLGHGTALP